ncbi:vomeronasal type-2 receptor 26-like [Podarcis muralis]
MAPNEVNQYMGIIRLLQSFRWTWVGLLAVGDDSGDHFLQTMEPLLSQNGICSAFTQRIPNQGRFLSLDELIDMTSEIYLPFLDSKVRTFVVFGESMIILWLSALVALEDPGYRENAYIGKVWIMTTQIDFAVTGQITRSNFQIFQGSISFTIHSNQCLGFQGYIRNIQSCKTQDNGFFRAFWQHAFDCSLPNSSVPMDVDGICTGEEKVENLPESIFEMQMTGHSYSVYNAVYAVAHALHSMGSSRSNLRAMAQGKRLQDIQTWQVQS